PSPDPALEVARRPQPPLDPGRAHLEGVRPAGRIEPLEVEATADPLADTGHHFEVESAISLIPVDGHAQDAAAGLAMEVDLDELHPGVLHDRPDHRLDLHRQRRPT